jgi:two-component system chemotaxis response regulator CheB
MHKDIIVIGASAGGIDALRVLLGGLAGDFPAGVLIVVHTSPNSPGALGEVLQRATSLEVVSVSYSDEIRRGVVYVSMPDRHLVVEPGIVRTTSGPRENRFRPAIDPLFRSAARSYGERVIGVVLTGYLDDGTAGLWSIKERGGTAVVQDPDDAVADSMPRSALNHVDVDHCVPLDAMAPLLIELTSERAGVEPMEVPQAMKIENDIANERWALEAGVLTLGDPSNYACPECHGVLLQIREADRVRFRCHTGHAYSADSLVAEMMERSEEAVWNVLRALEEGVVLMQNLAAGARDKGEYAVAQRLLDEADEAQARAEAVRRALPRSETESAD